MSFDDELKRRMQQAVRPPTNEAAVLRQVGPRLRRARRARRLMVASTVAAVVGVAGIAGAQVAHNLGDQHQLRGVVPLGDDGGQPTQPASSLVVVPASAEPASTEAAPTTVSAGPSAIPTVAAGAPNPNSDDVTMQSEASTQGSAATSESEAESESTGPHDGGRSPVTTAPSTETTVRATGGPPTSAAAPSTSDDSGRTDPPRTSQPTTTSQPSTSAPASTTPVTNPASPATINSGCGTVVVNIDAAKNRVTIASTSPKPGFTVDIGDNGPRVEVGFTNGSHQCEVTASVTLGVYHQHVDD